MPEGEAEDFSRSPPNAREYVRSEILAGGICGRDGHLRRFEVNALIEGSMRVKYPSRIDSARG
jgi:hypothetical protein